MGIDVHVKEYVGPRKQNGLVWWGPNIAYFSISTTEALFVVSCLVSHTIGEYIFQLKYFFSFQITYISFGWLLRPACVTCDTSIPYDYYNTNWFSLVFINVTHDQYSNFSHVVFNMTYQVKF